MLRRPDCFHFWLCLFLRNNHIIVIFCNIFLLLPRIDLIVFVQNLTSALILRASYLHLTRLNIFAVSSRRNLSKQSFQRSRSLKQRLDRLLIRPNKTLFIFFMKPTVSLGYHLLPFFIRNQRMLHSEYAILIQTPKNFI